MAITIGSSSALGGLRFLESATHGLRRRLETLASGDRISRASYDAAGLAISETLRSLIGSRDQGLRNLSDGVSVTRVAEGALEETSGLLGRMRELSVQAQNGTLGAAEKRAIQQEFDSLAQEVTRIAQRTEFNGKKLLDGTSSGDTAVAIHDGSGGDPIEVSVDDQSAEALGVGQLDASNGATLDKLDAAIHRVARSRASLGSAENRIESSIRQTQVELENLSDAESRIRDADYAYETSLLASDGVRQQIGIAVRAQANLSAQAALVLLRPGDA